MKPAESNESLETVEISEQVETPADTNQEEQPSLIDAVKNEGFDIPSESIDLTDLEAFETPIDLTLPKLEPDDDLPSLEEITEDESPQEHETQSIKDQAQDSAVTEMPADDNLELLESVAPLEDIVPQTLDDIAQNVNFSEPEVQAETQNQASSDIQDLPQQFKDLGNDEELQDVDLSDFEMEQQPQENQQQAEEPQISDSSNDDDDMSGLEEFTMDMAAAVEEANPNLNNPQIPVDDAMNDAFSAFNDFSTGCASISRVET
jgi:hypothetical protein